MKNFDCITNNSKFSDDEKAQGQELYQQYLLKFGGATDQAVEATEKALTVMQKIKKADNLRAAKVFATRLLDIEKFVEGNGRWGDGILNLIAPDPQGYMRHLNLENYAEAIRKRGIGMMNKFVMQYRKRGLFGARGSGMQGVGKNNVDIQDVVKEVWGIETKNADAKILAQAWKEVAEFLRLEKNRQGAHIPKLEHYLPQTHSQLKLRNLKGGVDEWKEFIQPLLATDRMIDFDTGQPITPLKLETLLNDVYDSISNGGYSNRKGAWSKTMSQHRILQFKDGEAWLKYHNKFGDGDITISMINYIDQMSRDIAELHILGPKPQQTLNMLVSKMDDAHRKDGTVKITPRTNIQNHYDVFKRRQLLTDHQLFADIASATRNTFTAVYLGGAVLSALGDFNTQMNTAMRVGMKQKSAILRHVKNIFQFVGAKDRKQFLLESGVIFDNMLDFAQKKAKFAGEVAGPAWSQIMSDVVIRASGLSAFTDGGRSAFAQEFMIYAGKQLGKSFDELDPMFQQTLKTYGLDKDWEIISQAKTKEFQGLKYLRYKEIDELDMDIGTRYLQMISNLQNDAVIVGNIKTTAKMYGAEPRGTIGGELTRTAFMFKNFSVSVVIQYLYRLFKEATPRTKHFGMEFGHNAAKAINVTKFIGMATIIGAISEQLHNLARGRDPEDMTNAEFWGKAFTRGGGVGFLGDIFTNTVQGYGTNIFGPGFDATTDVMGLTFGNLYDMAHGEDTNFSYELYSLLRKYTPGQTLWYGHLAFNRLGLEQLAIAIDPNLKGAIKRNARRRERRNKQKYWWSPGRTLPKRAPDLEALTPD